MNSVLIAVTAIVGTCIIYLIAFTIHQKVQHTFSIPVLTSTIAIIIVLVLFQASYDTYMTGGKWIDELLGPAVVALAYPLYLQRDILKAIFLPLLVGTFIGAVAGISSGILLTKAAGFDTLIINSIVSKSVTTPVAMVVSNTVGGVTSLTAVFVMIAGIGGVLLHKRVFKLFRLNHYLGRGVGIGSASHAIGTATAMENSQTEGSVSTIAMVSSAVIVSIVTPGLMVLLL
ncbi:LrgB family protein [Virgibacillus siamensis]|uniref:LrgB family protein n=1 Tax=Virgibacillus siamensis TaxID=480071 RepID=UPI0009847934|nr:LrgB family protein [Virgibacillus siamensis]